LSFNRGRLNNSRKILDYGDCGLRGCWPGPDALAHNGAAGFFIGKYFMGSGVTGGGIGKIGNEAVLYCPIGIHGRAGTHACGINL